MFFHPFLTPNLDTQPLALFIVYMHIIIILNLYYYNIIFIFHHIYNRYVCVCLLITNVFVLCKKSTLGMVMGDCCRHLVPLFILTFKKGLSCFALSSTASRALPLPYFIMWGIAFHLWEQVSALLCF
jgi:hypothetical protein